MERGSMMRKKQYLRYVAVIVSCISLCGVLAGCGIKDSAMVIPIGEVATDETGIGSEDNLISVDDSMDAVNSESDANPKAGESDFQPLICVYVCGAVVNPGVYEIPEGSRVNDALQAAGGLAENAGEEQVNLAAKVADGEQIYFPTEAEAREMAFAAQDAADGLVNINTADAALLMTLPGIGETRAEAIIAYREEHGAFTEEKDIMNVPGIKENMYEKLCDKIIVR